MAKTPITLAPDLIPDRPPRRRWLPILSLFAAAALLAPVVLDAATLCYARWSEVLGDPIDVRTPALDAIGEHTAVVVEVVRYHVSTRFRRVPWDPRAVLAVSIAVMTLGILLLRR